MHKLLIIISLISLTISCSENKIAESSKERGLSAEHAKEFEKDIIKIIEKKLKFPVVIKPINEGSSVHVYICTKKNIIKRV